MDNGDQNTKQTPLPPSQNKKKTLITVPSYQEVIASSQINSTATQQQNLFTPSQSFSQAFSFIKSSEFYNPPTVKPAPARNPTQGGEQNGGIVSTSSSLATQSRNAILVSHRQKGNPLLKHIRNVRWAFADVVCDYLLGQNSCALYLSLRYHLLHPDYLYYRIRELQKNFKLRVVLCHVDVEDVIKPLLEVTKMALLHDCTLLCAWSLEECGRYLETIKVYENKPADLIQGQMDTDYISRLTHALTTVRHVNKTDVVTLGSTFGSLSHIMDASMEDLAHCPGIGERKVKRLYDTFHEPFKRAVSSHPFVPETPCQKDAEPSSVSEVTEMDKDTEDANKRRKKEPELTVKSALSAAFAKYADKIGKKNSSSQGGETSAAKSDTENKNSSSGTAS